MLVSCGADAIIGTEVDIYQGVPFYVRNDGESEAEWYTRRGRLIVEFGELMLHDYTVASQSGDEVAVRTLYNFLDEYHFESDEKDEAIVTDDESVDETSLDEVLTELERILRAAYSNDLQEDQTQYSDTTNAFLNNPDYAKMIIESLQQRQAMGEIEALVTDAKVYATMLIRNATSI